MNEQLVELLAFALDIPIEQVTPDMSPQTVAAWDSLKNVLMLAMLEQEYDLTFSTADRDQMTTAGRIEALLSKRGVL